MKYFLIITLIFCTQIVLAQATILPESFRSNLSKNDIAILGEVHSDLASKKHLPSIVDAIIQYDPRYNCLSLEFDHSHQADLDRSHTEEDYISLTHTMYIKVMGQGYHKLSQSHILKAINSHYREFEPWFQSSEVMRSKSGKVFFLDNFENTSTDVATVTARNIFVAKNIHSLIQNKTCNKFIVIIGAAHTRKESGLPLQTFLSNYGGYKSQNLILNQSAYK